ncbi:MAG: hypothetical protein ACRELY_27830 [Polyangiaceae bacterium]
MRSARALFAAICLSACATTSAPTNAPTGTSIASASRPALRPSSIEEVSAPAVAPPRTMPARYLRTLEHDPGGYDAPGVERTSPNAGKASDLLLGDLLFHSPRTLGVRAQAMQISCNTCHPNGATHTTLSIDSITDRPGNVDVSSSMFRAASDDGIFDPVNIPSLRGCRYTPPYGRDGRIASLSEFVENVVVTEFDGAPLSQPELAALVRYVLDLDFLPNAQLDARGDLADGASAAAHRGAAEFSRPRAGFGGSSCASCHPSSSFFRDGMVHRLDAGDPPSPHAIENGYETPTLLGLAESAPYFHDGRFATLRDVVAWFDRAYALGLSPSAEADLTAYVETVGAVDRSFDDRPLARRLDQTFAYLSLLTAEQKDRRVWIAAIEAVSRELANAPPAVASRAAAMRDELGAMRTRVAEGALLAPEADRARALRESLARLAADWAGSSQEK